MEALTLLMTRPQEVDMAKLTKKSIKHINKLKLDNVTSRHTTGNGEWAKYVAY